MPPLNKSSVIGLLWSSRQRGYSARKINPPPSIFHGKEFIYRVYIHRLAKPPWAGNQGDIIAIFPPFFDKFCFVNIKAMLGNNPFEILLANRDGSCHVISPPWCEVLGFDSVRVIAFAGSVCKVKREIGWEFLEI